MNDPNTSLVATANKKKTTTKSKTVNTIVPSSISSANQLVPEPTASNSNNNNSRFQFFSQKKQPNTNNDTFADISTISASTHHQNNSIVASQNTSVIINSSLVQNQINSLIQERLSLINHRRKSKLAMTVSEFKSLFSSSTTASNKKLHTPPLLTAKNCWTVYSFTNFEALRQGATGLLALNQLRLMGAEAPVNKWDDLANYLNGVLVLQEEEEENQNQNQQASNFYSINEDEHDIADAATKTMMAGTQQFFESSDRRSLSPNPTNQQQQQRQQQSMLAIPKNKVPPKSPKVNSQIETTVREFSPPVLLSPSLLNQQESPVNENNFSGSKEESSLTLLPSFPVSMRVTTPTKRRASSTSSQNNTSRIMNNNNPNNNEREPPSRSLFSAGGVENNRNEDIFDNRLQHNNNNNNLSTANSYYYENPEEKNNNNFDEHTNAIFALLNEDLLQQTAVDFESLIWVKKFFSGATVGGRANPLLTSPMSNSLNESVMHYQHLHQNQLIKNPNNNNSLLLLSPIATLENSQNLNTNNNNNNCSGGGPFVLPRSKFSASSSTTNKNANNNNNILSNSSSPPAAPASSTPSRQTILAHTGDRRMSSNTPTRKMSRQFLPNEFGPTSSTSASPPSSPVRQQDSGNYHLPADEERKRRGSPLIHSNNINNSEHNNQQPTLASASRNNISRNSINNTARSCASSIASFGFGKSNTARAQASLFLSEARILALNFDLYPGTRVIVPTFANRSLAKQHNKKMYFDSYFDYNNNNTNNMLPPNSEISATLIVDVILSATVPQTQMGTDLCEKVFGSGSWYELFARWIPTIFFQLQCMESDAKDHSSKKENKFEYLFGQEFDDNKRNQKRKNNNEHESTTSTLTSFISFNTIGIFLTRLWLKYVENSPFEALHPILVAQCIRHAMSSAIAEKVDMSTTGQLLMDFVVDCFLENISTKELSALLGAITSIANDGITRSEVEHWRMSEGFVDCFFAENKNNRDDNNDDDIDNDAKEAEEDKKMFYAWTVDLTGNAAIRSVLQIPCSLRLNQYLAATMNEESSTTLEVTRFVPQDESRSCFVCQLMNTSSMKNEVLSFAIDRVMALPKSSVVADNNNHQSNNETHDANISSNQIVVYDENQNTHHGAQQDPSNISWISTAADGIDEIIYNDNNHHGNSRLRQQPSPSGELSLSWTNVFNIFGSYLQKQQLQAFSNKNQKMSFIGSNREFAEALNSALSVAIDSRTTNLEFPEMPPSQGLLDCSAKWPECLNHNQHQEQKKVDDFFSDNNNKDDDKNSAEQNKQKRTSHHYPSAGSHVISGFIFGLRETWANLVSLASKDQENVLEENEKRKQQQQQEHTESKETHHGGNTNKKVNIFDKLYKAASDKKINFSHIQQQHQQNLKHYTDTVELGPSRIADEKRLEFAAAAEKRNRIKLLDESSIIPSLRKNLADDDADDDEVAHVDATKNVEQHNHNNNKNTTSVMNSTAQSIAPVPNEEFPVWLLATVDGQSEIVTSVGWETLRRRLQASSCERGSDGKSKKSISSTTPTTTSTTSIGQLLTQISLTAGGEPDANANLFMFPCPDGTRQIAERILQDYHFPLLADKIAEGFEEFAATCADFANSPLFCFQFDVFSGAGESDADRKLREELIKHGALGLFTSIAAAASAEHGFEWERSLLFPPSENKKQHESNTGQNKGSTNLIKIPRLQMLIRVPEAVDEQIKIQKNSTSWRTSSNPKISSHVASDDEQNVRRQADISMMTSTSNEMSSFVNNNQNVSFDTRQQQHFTFFPAATLPNTTASMTKRNNNTQQTSPFGRLHRDIRRTNLEKNENNSVERSSPTTRSGSTKRFQKKSSSTALSRLLRNRAKISATPEV